MWRQFLLQVKAYHLKRNNQHNSYFTFLKNKTYSSSRLAATWIKQTPLILQTSSSEKDMPCFVEGEC